MTNQHPITPPPELVQQWREQMPVGIFDGYKYPEREKALCLVAAQWGADQELEACCAEMSWNGNKALAVELRNRRRPKPPTLKEQALTALSHLLSGSAQTLDTTEAEFYIRRALEALPND
jgi:hypothetical protein